MADFGQKARRLRNTARMSLRQLAGRAGIDWGYLGQIERGERRCSIDFAEILDQALTAKGALIEAWEVDMRRRVVLGATAALPLVAVDAVGLGAAPAIGSEALRHDLAATLNGTVADWDEVAWQYACTYADTPPGVLRAKLETDLMVAGLQLHKLTDDLARRTVQRAIAQLSVVMAQTVGNLGDWMSSYRWWRTARQYADASQDTATQVWARGREVVRGIVERRPLPPLLELADEAEAISTTPGIGTGEVVAGRAQVLARMGRADDARTALSRVYDAFDALPDQVTGDTVSIFGWSECRLRHTESYVYTHLDDAAAADAAHDRALALYSAAMFRGAAQVELHRALRLVRVGDPDGGVGHARQAIEALPADQRIEAVLELARSVVAAVPAAEQRRPHVAELRQMVALPTAPAN